MSAVPVVTSSDPVVTPLYYVPVVGACFEARKHQIVEDRIKNLVSAEKRDTAKQTLRMGELTHLIELRIHFFEEGQKRSLLSIALCIAAIVTFPHSLAVGIFAGTFISVPILCYLGVRNAIAAHAKVLKGLEGKTTFGEEILRGLSIQ